LLYLWGENQTATSEKNIFKGNLDVNVWADLIANITDNVDLDKFEKYIHELEQKIEQQLSSKREFDDEVDASINLLEFQKALFQQMEFKSCV
jgi:hypothetical protein